MKWTKKASSRFGNPFYYEAVSGNMVLSLRLPYKSDPWSMWLMEGPMTIMKETFRLRSEGRSEYEDLWESVDDLEKAQQKTLDIALEYVNANVDKWTNMYAALASMNNTDTCSRLSLEEMEAQMKEKGCVEGTVKVPLQDIIACEQHCFTDLLSVRLTGNFHFDVRTYHIVSFENDMLYISVSGDAAKAIESERSIRQRKDSGI